MYKILYYEKDGTPVWGDFNGNPVTPQKEVVIKPGAKSNKWYNSLIDNAGEIFQGAGSLVSAIKGNPSNITYQNYDPAPTPDNGNKMIIIAIVAVLVLIAILFFIKKQA